jgi:hypothetical protein
MKLKFCFKPELVDDGFSVTEIDSDGLRVVAQVVARPYHGLLVVLCSNWLAVTLKEHQSNTSWCYQKT